MKEIYIIKPLVALNAFLFDDVLESFVVSLFFITEFATLNKTSLYFKSRIFYLAFNKDKKKKKKKKEYKFLINYLIYKKKNDKNKKLIFKN